jgi:amino acid adenylation domain-containing protein
MNLHLLINSLAERGIKLTLSPTGDGLIVDAPKGSLTPELREILTTRRAETIELLHQHRDRPPANDLPQIVPAPEQRYEPFPLTDMQHAFWIGRSGILELGHVSNHGYYEIEGEDLDVGRLNAALQRLIERHDMLRAIVLPDGQQRVLPEVPPYEMAVVDLREHSSAAVEEVLAAIRAEMSHQVLPADRYPLFDFRATRMPDQRLRLHISYDLLVFDAWSLFRLFEEWWQIYQQPDCSLPSLDLSFRDYAIAEQSLCQTELYKRSRTYWLDRIDKLPPAPDLPLAKNPKALTQHRCRRHQAGLTRDKWQRLQQRARTIGLTPSGLLLAAFAEIIALWSQSPQFTLNLALFNRLPMHPQVNNLLGDFTSVTLLAVDNTANDTFRDRALGIQTQLWQDLEHRYYSGVRVTRELTRRRGNVPNTMPVIFTSTLGFAGMGQETLTFSHFGELVYGISQASQAWMDIQVWEEKETLTFNWDVVEELFPEGAIADMFAAYCNLLLQLADDGEIWDAPVLQLLTPEQLQPRAAVNNTAAPISDALLHEMFLDRVRQAPEALAVIAEDKSFTYGELSDRAHQVAHRLRKLGVGANQLIGVVMDKGWEQIVAVMGILIAGAAYVPIAPNLPPERLQYLLKHSDIDIVLTQSPLVEKLTWGENIQRLAIDGEELATESTTPLSSIQTPDDLAYVIYTSGSTGLPKGVMISHRNVANVVVYTNQHFQIQASDRVLALTALNHDLSVYDIFGLLAAGGAIVIPAAPLVKDPLHWAQLIQREGVTIWNSVPPMMEMLVNTIGEPTTPIDSKLRLAILGGDWLPLSLPDRIRKLAPAIELLSIGGPTETTIWNIGYQIGTVDPSWKSIPYGQPMANATYYIFNDKLADCPTWVPGEMYCAGVQVAKGYWRDPERTQTSFIIHPRTGERLYRTGDRGRYLPDGTIEILGRVDFQIKLRGYRIEAGEIEAALMQHPDVKTAIVKIVGESQQQQLAAYIIPDRAEVPTIEALSEFLNRKLPDYAVPSCFLWLDTLPLSANGKIDRQALPTALSAFQQRQTVYSAPQNEIENAIADIVRSVLEIDRLGVTNNFFDLGANSLLITNIYRRLGEILPDKISQISLIDLFNYPTVRVLAQRLNNNDRDNDLEREQAEANHQISQGKNRLQQRLAKSKLMQM